MILLGKFNNTNDYDRGSNLVKYLLWLVAGELVASWVPGSSWRVLLLRSFGAKLGSKIVVKPHVRVKLPWKLKVGSNCWIGEYVWIDNTEFVLIGENVCISQGTFICTGSHDFQSPYFRYSGKRIVIGNHVWICAKCIILAGVEVGAGTMVAAGETIRKPLAERTLAIDGKLLKIRGK